MNAMNMIWYGISLFAAAIGVLVLIGLSIGFVREMQQGGVYVNLLPWAVLLVVLLVVAYLTRLLGRDDW